MTSLRQEQRQSAPEYTTEDAERLARDFMGWRLGSECYADATAPLEWYFERGGQWYHVARAKWPWNPFRDADADLQVLERAREVWQAKERDSSRTTEFSLWFEFGVLLPRALDYRVGDFSRAALEVLRSTEGAKP